MWYAKMYFSEKKEVFQFDSHGIQGVPSTYRELPFLESLLSFLETDCKELESLLRRAYPVQQSEQIVYGGVALHLESSSLDYDGQSVELTKNELKILYYLFKNAGKICSRGDLVEFLWDNQLYVDDNALSVNINRIREKLAGIGLTDFIKTKHRQGYTI